jgi:hypothetical protein
MHLKLFRLSSHSMSPSISLTDINVRCIKVHSNSTHGTRPGAFSRVSWSVSTLLGTMPVQRRHPLLEGHAAVAFELGTAAAGKGGDGMDSEPRPRRDDRQLWPIIATVATIARTIVEVWRLLRG